MDVCIDFDGSCLTHEYPSLGKDIGAVPVLKRLVKNGHNLILWTMRSDGQVDQLLENGFQIHAGDFLTQAVEWFKENDIPLYGIQRNPEQDIWTSSPKAYAQLYLDDAALGCPLKFDEKLSRRPFIDWVRVEKMLEEMTILKY